MKSIEDMNEDEINKLIEDELVEVNRLHRVYSSMLSIILGRMVDCSGWDFTDKGKVIIYYKVSK